MKTPNEASSERESVRMAHCNTIEVGCGRLETRVSHYAILTGLVGRGGRSFVIQSFQRGGDAPFIDRGVRLAAGAALQNVQGGRHHLIRTGRLGSSPTRAIRPGVQNRGSEAFDNTFTVGADAATIERVPRLE